jgi:hypothetical protein
MYSSSSILTLTFPPPHRHGHNQESVFPAAFIDPVYKIPEKWHFNRLRGKGTKKGGGWKEPLGKALQRTLGATLDANCQPNGDGCGY